MLVRWSPVPEAERNGLVLGYKVSLCRLPHPGCPAPPGPSLCLLSGHGGSVWLPIHLSPWQPESYLGGEGGWASRKGMGSLGLLCLPQEVTLGAPSLMLRSWAQCQFLSPSRILPQSQAPAWTSGDVPAGPGSAAAGCVTLRKSHALSGLVCSLRKLPAPWLSASLGPRFPVPRGALGSSHCKEPRSTRPVHPSAPGQGT